MPESTLFPTPSWVQAGCRVRIMNPGDKHYGRTAKVLSPATAPGAGGSHWLVAFDWPLGGLSGRAEYAEADLEVLPFL